MSGSVIRRAEYSILPTPTRDLLGEGPWWSAAEQTLLWVDIWGRKVRRSALDGAGYAEWSMPSDVGFAVPGAGGLIAVGLVDGIHWLDPGSGSLSRSSLGPALAEGHRLNDGKSDRAGRLWFGSIREDGARASAALYRYDGTDMEVVLDGVTTSNGLGWTASGERMYYTDSPARTITAYDFDGDAGTLASGTLFSADPQAYTPDGLTVDAEGHVWSAKWDGGRIVRYDPDGVPVLELELPVRRPTSCMFVGEHLDVIAVTSAQSPDDDAVGRSLAGSVFLVRVESRGLPERPLAFGPSKPQSDARTTNKNQEPGKWI